MTIHGKSKSGLRRHMVAIRFSEVDLRCLRALLKAAQLAAPGQSVSVADVVRRCVHHCHAELITESAR